MLKACPPVPRGHLPGSAPAKDRRNYYDSGEQEQEEGGNVPEGGQDHHAEQDCRQRSPAWDAAGLR